MYSEMLDKYNNFKDVQDIPYVVDLKKSHLSGLEDLSTVGRD